MRSRLAYILSLILGLYMLLGEVLIRTLSQKAFVYDIYYLIPVGLHLPIAILCLAIAIYYLARLIIHKDKRPAGQCWFM